MMFIVKKCSFISNKTSYLRHVIFSGKLQVASDKKDAIEELSYPTNVFQVRSLSGLCNVYRKCAFNNTQFPKTFESKIEEGKTNSFWIGAIQKGTSWNNEAEVKLYTGIAIALGEASI